MTNRDSRAPRVRTSLVFPLLLLVALIGAACSDGDSVRQAGEEIPDSSVTPLPSLAPSVAREVTTRGVSSPPSGWSLEDLAVGLSEPGPRYLAEFGGAVLATPNLSAPGPGESVLLPDFRTTLERITGTPWGNHDYSQLQPFSHDGRYVLLIEGESEGEVDWVVRSWPELEPVYEGTAGWNVPRWHPTDFGKMVHFDSNEDETLRLQQTDVAGGAVEAVFTFPSEYERVRGNQSFDEISRTGEWLAGMAATSSGQTIFAFNLAEGRLGVELDLDELYRGRCAPDPQWGNLEPDWIGVSPLGNWLMVQWAAAGTDRCNGLEAFDIETGEFTGRVTAGHPHGDLALLSDGTTEVFVTTELSGPPPGDNFVGGQPGDGDVDGNYPALSYRTLPGPPSGEQEPSYLYLTDWILEHVSCRGPSGWCLATFVESLANGAADPLEGELVLFRLDGEGIARLGHHRSSSGGYWQQPRASISNDGRYVIFDSDWKGGGPPGPPAVYVIDLSVQP